MLLGQELKFKNKLCNLKLGTFFSALRGKGLGESGGASLKGKGGLVGFRKKSIRRSFESFYKFFS